MAASDKGAEFTRAVVKGQLPAGAARLTAGAVGLHGTWINGQRVANEKGFCADPASRPGKVLRSFEA